MKAGVWILHAGDSATKDHPAGDHDEKQNDHLDRTEDVHATDSPTRQESMEQRDGHDNCDGDSALLPLGGCFACSNDHIGGEDDTTLGFDGVSSVSS